MSGGSLQLREYPAELVRLSCAKCRRIGQYRKQNLIERFGRDIRRFDSEIVISRRQTFAKLMRRSSNNRVD
jgi:hypothetical protein